MYRKVSLATALVILMALPCGCGVKTQTKSFLREDVELGYVQRVAVLPFENNSDDQHVAARVRDLTITQGLAMGLFDMVDKGLIDSVLGEEAIDPGSALDAPTVKRLGQRLNVQALLLGAVDQAGEGRRGNFSFPEIALTLRLVDVNTGILLWQTSGYGNGYSIWGRLFGLAPRDSFMVNLKTVQRILETVPARTGR